MTTAALATTAGCHRSRQPRHNLLLVTVDTLRADHLGIYGSSRDLSPNLDRLGKQSIVFDRAYAPTSFTLPSLGALMTSRYAEEVGIGGNSAVLSARASSLAVWFKSHRFRTGAVVSNYVLRPESGFGAGFELYDATFPQREAVRPVPERVATATTKAALAQLDRLRDGSAPNLLWIHYQDPHGPYSPPERYRTSQLEIERSARDGQRRLPVAQGVSGWGAIPRYQFFENHDQAFFYRAGYAGEVAYVDDAVGTLLAGITERGLDHSTVVVFASDHGEGLGEQDYWFSHGETLTDPLVHVPLFIRIPGRAAGRRSDVVSLLDLFPTLATLLTGTAPAGLRGRDLLASGAETRASEIYLTTLKVSPIPRAGLIAIGHKYLVESGSDGLRERLYAIGAEIEDLAPRQPDLLRSLRTGLEAARAGLRRVDSQPQAMSPEERERFRTLGYVEGG